MARQRTSIVTRMRARADRRCDRRAAAPTVRGRPAPRSAWRDRAMPLSCCCSSARDLARARPAALPASADRAGCRAPSRSSVPGTSGAAARRSRAWAASSTAGGTHGSNHFAEQPLGRRARRRGAPTICAAASSITLMIEHRASRLERMRHRRAIDLHEDVVGQVVALIPLLQPRQQRARRRRESAATACALGQRAAGASTSRLDDRLEQVVGKHRPAPHEPCLRAERHRRQPALAARVDRHAAARRRRSTLRSASTARPSRRAPAHRRTACSRRTARRRRRRSGRPSRAAAPARRRRRSESPRRRRTARRSDTASVSATRTQSGVTICS